MSPIRLQRKPHIVVSVEETNVGVGCIDRSQEPCIIRFTIGVGRIHTGITADISNVWSRGAILDEKLSQCIGRSEKAAWTYDWQSGLFSNGIVVHQLMQYRCSNWLHFVRHAVRLDTVRSGKEEIVAINIVE